nr:hypothetical protein Iba_chr07fCG2510 [Ipomoea batatas]
MLCKNCILIAGSRENLPSTAIVAVLLPTFSIPRDIIHVWLASTTTITSSPRTDEAVSAICLRLNTSGPFSESLGNPKRSFPETFSVDILTQSLQEDSDRILNSQSLSDEEEEEMCGRWNDDTATQGTALFCGTGVDPVMFCGGYKFGSL